MKRVLIVDDSPIIHNLLRKVLERNGYEVCGDAKNGKEGVDLYAELKPDLVFMDITMPVMEGIDAARFIKEKDPSAKIIMLSAMGDDAIKEEAHSIGVDIFLKKPFDDYKIVSAIAKIV
ncbi:response regulator [Anoxynatronum buryatiense]|uniref:Stage 0 sporulation protein A homolog n=1 Tax=Anoxynatronum buryatiense TaxID=489973 RepID=A0AA46AIB2_9CLOT|nr:response regulator [Anoxynatronum buryatiense]SMP48100.1 two-component system, chemotaxis family, response regulator CheY [Anoxynatronum buryatiense]